MEAATTQPVKQSPAILQFGIGRSPVPSKGDAVVKVKHRKPGIVAVSKF